MVLWLHLRLHGSHSYDRMSTGTVTVQEGSSPGEYELQGDCI